jgi:hypothetical protein
MSTYKLRLDNLQFVNQVTEDHFYAAPNANIFPKLFYYLLEQGIRWNETKVSNTTLMNKFNASERAIQFELKRFQDLKLIDIEYETNENDVIIDRKLIRINLEEFKKYLGYSRYDDEYRVAQKRGWFRRLINQLPIEIINFFERAMERAKKAKDEARMEYLKKRQENYQKHVEKSLKRHQMYTEAKTLEEAAIDRIQKDPKAYREVLSMIELIGKLDFQGHVVRRQSDIN